MDSAEVIKTRLSGFHYDALGADLQRKALKLVDVARNKTTGVYQGVVHRASSLKKTFYPEYWSPEQVVKKIMEAAGKIEKISESGSRFVLDGRTNCGVKIRMVLEMDGRLVTAFPII